MAGGRATKDLIDRIYASALEPDTWAIAVEEIGKAIGADAAYVYLPSSTHFAQDAIGWNMLDVEAARRIAAETRRADAYTEGAIAKGLTRPGAIGVGELVCDDRRWDENPWSELAYKHIDVRPYMGFAAAMPAQADAMRFGLFRRTAGTPFGASDLARLKMLRPHIERAGRMAFRIRAEAGVNRMLRSLADAHAEPTMILDETFRIVEANKAAETMLATRKRFCIARGQVDGIDSLSSDRLKRALTEALRLSGSEIWLQDHEGQPFLCALSPMTLSNSRPGVLLVMEPPQMKLSPARLARLFALTPAEIAVVMGLLDGKSVSEIASARDVAIGTVRAQLRAIFGKTGADSQARLVAMLARLRSSPPGQ